MKSQECLVCHMSVTTNEFKTIHHGLTYLFCSKQCKQNFDERPRLYLKPPARQVLKSHKFKLKEDLGSERQEEIKSLLLEMMGVQYIDIKQRTLSIQYNLLEVSAVQIEQSLQAANVALDLGWLSQFKRGLIHYSEKNELELLSESEGSCCNKPPAKR